MAVRNGLCKQENSGLTPRGAHMKTWSVVMMCNLRVREAASGGSLDNQSSQTVELQGGPVSNNKEND